MTILQMITSLLTSGRVTQTKISGILQPTIKQRHPNGRTSGSSKQVGTRKFPPQSPSPSGWKDLHYRVGVQVASITSFLPCSDNNEGQHFGTAHGLAIPSSLTHLQEFELRREKVQAQFRDAEDRRVVFDADPSPDAEIPSEVIDHEVLLGVMDPTDVCELVGAFFQPQVIIVTFVQASSSREVDMKMMQALPLTQPTGDEGTREGLDPVTTTQILGSVIRKIQDRGVDCYCEVNVCHFPYPQPEVTCPPSVKILMTASGANAAGAGITPGKNL